MMVMMTMIVVMADVMMVMMMMVGLQKRAANKLTVPDLTAKYFDDDEDGGDIDDADT